jgi:hypothetical protein
MRKPKAWKPWCVFYGVCFAWPSMPRRVGYTSSAFGADDASSFVPRVHVSPPALAIGVSLLYRGMSVTFDGCRVRPRSAQFKRRAPQA